jgi:hypothetical protein
MSRGGSEQTSSGPPQDINMADDEKDAAELWRPSKLPEFVQRQSVPFDHRIVGLDSVLVILQPTSPLGFCIRRKLRLDEKHATKPTLDLGRCELRGLDP